MRIANQIGYSNSYNSAIQFKGSPKKVVSKVASTTEQFLLPRDAEADRAIQEILSIKNPNIYIYDLPGLLESYMKNKNLGQYLIGKTYKIKSEKGEITKHAYNATEVASMLRSGAEDVDVKYLTAIVDENGRPRFNGYEIAELSPEVRAVKDALYVENLAKEKTSTGTYKYGAYQIKNKLSKLKKTEAKRPKGQGVFD